MIPMADKTYSGWTNYETWCVNLWLTNEPYTEGELRMLAQMSASEYERADCVKRFVEELMPDLEASMFSDLLRSALDNVNWREIVENHEHDDED